MRLILYRWSRVAGLVSMAAALVLIDLVSARADDVPGIGNWEQYHYSLDRTPISVTLTRDSREEGFPALSIPRSYVYFVVGAPSSTEGPLPATLKTDELGIAFAEPEGEAWTKSVEDYRARHGGSRESAAKALRTRQYKMRLSVNANPQFEKSAKDGVARTRRRVATVYGLDEYVGKSSTATYYIGSKGDEFVTAECPNPSRPEILCGYRFVVTSGISGEVYFSDFRLYGGREYANRRVTFARQVVCRFLKEC